MFPGANLEGGQGGCKMPPPYHPIPSHRPPAGTRRERPWTHTMARVSSPERAGHTGRRLQLQLHSHDSLGVRWPLQKHKSAVRFVRAVRVEHSGPARG